MAHPDFIRTDKGYGRVYLVKGPMGNAGKPEGHVNHAWHIRTGSPGYKANGLMALDYSLEYLEPETVAIIRKRIGA